LRIGEQEWQVGLPNGSSVNREVQALFYEGLELKCSGLLTNLRDRGITSPKLTIGDGALGFWGAITAVFPEAKHQRCWFHKMGNVLDKLPKSQQTKAKSMLQEIWMAATKKEADEAFDAFIAKYEAKYPKATTCLEKDKEALLTFYDFPAEHWIHIRTTNPI
jgi:putative transposase